MVTRRKGEGDTLYELTGCPHDGLTMDTRRPRWTHTFNTNMDTVSTLTCDGHTIMPASHCPDFDPRGHTNIKCSSSPEVKPKGFEKQKDSQSSRDGCRRLRDGIRTINEGNTNLTNLDRIATRHHDALG